MLTFMEAIARQEGFYASGHNIPKDNNNPGDLENEPWEKKYNSLPTAGRFADFDTVADGFAAMRALLDESYLGLTVFQAIHRWAPSVENNDDIYVKDVCAWTGLTPTTILTPALIS